MIARLTLRQQMVKCMSPPLFPQSFLINRAPARNSLSSARFFDDAVGAEGKFLRWTGFFSLSRPRLRGVDLAFFVPSPGKSNKRLASQLLPPYSYKTLVTAAGSRNV